MSKKAVDVESLQAEYKELQKKYKKLEREKVQTEAALKEMSALYALKKKLESILGETEGD